MFFYLSETITLFDDSDDSCDAVEVRKTNSSKKADATATIDKTVIVNYKENGETVKMAPLPASKKKLTRIAQKKKGTNNNTQKTSVKQTKVLKDTTALKKITNKAKKNGKNNTPIEIVHKNVSKP